VVRILRVFSGGVLRASPFKVKQVVVSLLIAHSQGKVALRQQGVHGDVLVRQIHIDGLQQGSGDLDLVGLLELLAVLDA
jgi:hypothetical protein